MANPLLNLYGDQDQKVKYFQQQASAARQLPGMEESGASLIGTPAAPIAGAATPMAVAANAGAGLSAVGGAIGGPVGGTLMGAGGGATLGTMLGIGGPAGAAIGGGLALISGLLGNAAKRKAARGKAESDRQLGRASILEDSANRRSLTLRSLL